MSHKPVAPPASEKEDWLTALDTHGVQFFVLNRVQNGEMLEYMLSQTTWRVDFEDQEAVILSRESHMSAH